MVNTNTYKNRASHPPREINKYIKHVLYINLNKRVDRRNRIKRELSVFDSGKVTRIPAIGDARGAVFSCAASHVKALEYAKAHNWPHVLILEDDAVWANVGRAYPVFKKLINNPFDVLMLGGTYPRYDKKTYRLHFAYSASCYIVMNSYYDTMIESVKKKLSTYNSKLHTLEKRHNIAVDKTYTELQAVDNWYIVMPALMIQGKSHSNIIGTVVNYKNAFKNKNNTRKQRGGGNLPEKVWCFWLGSTPMSEQRKNCLQAIKDSVGVEVELVTDDTLSKYIKPSAPFHEGYQYLSGTHKCDYARGYFMHHYGGGYADIKTNTTSWKPHFDDLKSDSNLWAIGYVEVDANGVAPAIGDEELTGKMKENYRELIGNCAYIFKAGTELTQAWVDQVNLELDKHFVELKAHPATHHRDGESGRITQYPIAWSGILGSIFHPLVYKFSKHIGKNLPPPQFKNYQ